MKGNLWILAILVLIAGVIVWLSVVMKPQVDKKEETVTAPIAAQKEVVVSEKSVTPTAATPAPTPPAPQPVPVVTPPTPATTGTKALLEQTFERGLTWLMNKQLENGALPDLEGKPDVAFTAMALICIEDAPGAVTGAHNTQFNKALNYILSKAQDDGSIIDPDKKPSFAIYKTALGLMALIEAKPAVNTPEMKDKLYVAITGATEYLSRAQYGPESDPKDSGGWGYDEKKNTPNANLSTTSYALDALNESDLPKDSEVYKKAVEFLVKCQDNSEYNKFRFTLNSGGFAYSPVESKAGKTTLPDGREAYKPYGSMTYAGLKSFIYANVAKDDPRVQSAFNWIKANYTLDENPGLSTDADQNLGKQGLFYYYHTFAKALDAYGDKVLVTPEQPGSAIRERYWARDLVAKLTSLQNPDGSWSNMQARWWEDFPPLATSYSLMALNLCRKWVD